MESSIEPASSSRSQSSASVRGIVEEALKAVREESELEFEIKEDTVLMGKSGVLDSIDVVTLTVEIEERVESRLGQKITLANEAAFSRKKSPFLNVPSLCEFIEELLQESRRPQS